MRAADGAEYGGADTDTTTGQQIDLDAGLLQGAKDPGVIGTGRTGTRQDERRTKMRRVGGAGF